ncbi:MAG TPA: glycosyltransferase family 1 protein [Steroidobacteraceae bacterium]|nr:glycosyltransferase family 1 protein [Steroidobacteraceae bacterium]
MKIAIMLRHFEQQEGGVKVYTKKLLPLLFSLGARHRYVLIYQNPKLIGTYSRFDNVEEVAATMPGTVPWDQIAVPWIARRKKVDLIFNPKFTVPFLTRAKTMFVLHGSEWFVIPEHFKKHDQMYFNAFVPLYCRSADAFIAVSHAVKADVVEHVGVDPAKVHAVHNGFDPTLFHQVTDQERLETVRQRYQLPERFILWCGQIESRKNVARLLRAFAAIADRVPHQLVLAGEQRWSTHAELEVIRELGIEPRIQFPGWIEHGDLPAVYSLADLFAFPSLYEGFGIPLIEAMACGCPIVTANTCAPPEVLAGSGRLVDPLSVEDIAAGMLEVLVNRPLRETMIAKGVERARDFGWERCARAVLDVFDSLDGSRAADLQGIPRSTTAGSAP